MKTLTFGDQAENHVGMQQLGEMVDEGQGFQLSDLEEMKTKLNSIGIYVEIHDLTKGDSDLPPAYLLVAHEAVSHILSRHSSFTSSQLTDEQMKLNVDKQAFMYGRVVNKNARWNLCFDTVGSDPDYEHGKGRIIAYADVPVTKAIMDQFPVYFGEKSNNLKGEGNYYYDIKQCGIGYHGDAERRKVIALRLGMASMPIYFQWYRMSIACGDRMEFNLNSGDIYVMSEKAVGTDWKKKKVYTLRHAAGCHKFTSMLKKL